jgi:hypothetical protein
MTRGKLIALMAATLLCPALPRAALAQSPKPGVAGYEVEWVYRVRYGFIDEWWDLFRKYEVPVLERGKQLGHIVDFRIYHPTQHTDEAARWDYRVEITYKDYASAGKMNALYDQLFPDAAARKKDDQRRWELTTNHWDLPIYQVDTTKSR